MLGAVPGSADPGEGAAADPGEGAAGGPSQEAAVAAALELGRRPAGAPPVCALCIDSDGTDGPTEAAGGLVDDLTSSVLADAGVDVTAALAAHAAGGVLAAAGDLVFTGPTGTNVNDLKLGLVGG